MECWQLPFCTLCNLGSSPAGSVHVPVAVMVQSRPDTLGSAVRDQLIPGAGCDYSSFRIRYSPMRRRTDVRGVRVRAVSVGGMA